MSDKNSRPHYQCLYAFCFLLATAPAPAIADQQKDPYRHFDLPRQPLQSGLVELALQADITVVANHELIQGHQSSPIIGPYRIEQALEKLLSRAPLTYLYNEQTNTYLIYKQPEELAPTAENEQLPEDATASIQEVIVYAPSYPFRYNTLANSQLQDGSAVYDASRFHTVLPAQFIDDQLPLDVGDLLKNGSGITPGDGRGDTNDDFYIRGFPRHSIYIDGFRVSNSTGVRFLPDNVERAEILKGPSTIRYGQGEPGGVVNLVRKKPLNEPLARLNLSVGNNGHQKISADWSNHVTEEIDYRINMVNVAQEKSADIRDAKQQLFAPSLRWQPNDRDNIDLSYEYQKTEQQAADDYAVLAPDPEENFPGATLNQLVKRARPGVDAEMHLLQIAAGRSISDTESNSGWRVNGSFTWQEEERFGVRSSADYLSSNLLFRPTEINNLYLLLIPGGQVAVPLLVLSNPADPDPLISIGTVRSVYDEESSETGLQSAAKLEGDVNVGGFVNNISVGTDWHHQDLFQSYTVESRNPIFRSWRDSETPSFTELFGALFAPNRPLGSLELLEFRQVSDEYGFYAQDTIEITEKLSATFGGRLSRIETTRELLAEDKAKELQPIQKLRTQTGFNYQISDTVQLFGNYAQGLRSNHPRIIVGDSIDEPELSDQWEGGVKSYLFDGRLSAGVAGYRINKNNIYAVDAITLNGFQPHEYGQRVLGIDLDLSFQMSSKTQLIGAFSAQDNVITYGPHKDNIPAATAPNTVSLFVYHEPTSAVAVNIGAYYVGRRYADHANSFPIESFYTFDAGAQYRWQMGRNPLRLRLNVKNLFNEEYYADVIAGVRLNRGAERQLIADLTLDL